MLARNETTVAVFSRLLREGELSLCSAQSAAWLSIADFCTGPGVSGSAVWPRYWVNGRRSGSLRHGCTDFR